MICTQKQPIRDDTTSFHVWAFSLGLTENLLWQPHKNIALETNLFQNFSGFSSFVQNQMFMTRSYLAHLFLEHEPLEDHFIWEAIASQYREKPSHTQLCFRVVVREKDANTSVYICARESLAQKVSYIVFTTNLEMQCLRGWRRWKEPGSQRFGKCHVNSLVDDGFLGVCRKSIKRSTFTTFSGIEVAINNRSVQKS